MSEKKKKLHRGNTADVADPFAEFRNEFATTFQERLIYFGNSLLVAAVPLYLFSAILRLNLREHFFFMFPLVIITAAILSIACAYTTYSVKLRLSQTRRDAVSSSTLGLKNTSKEEKRKSIADIRARQEQLTHIESVAFSLLYNSFFFLLALTFLSSYILSSLPILLNYIVSTASSLGAVLYSAIASTKS
jgi:hypothetical protein